MPNCSCFTVSRSCRTGEERVRRVLRVATTAGPVVGYLALVRHLVDAHPVEDDLAVGDAPVAVALLHPVEVADALDVVASRTSPWRHVAVPRDAVRLGPC